MNYSKLLRRPLAALAASMVVGIGVVFADGEPPDPDEWLESCTDAWDLSPASAFCSDVGIVRRAHDALTEPGKCQISNAVCSITVDVHEAGGGMEQREFSFTAAGPWVLVPHKVEAFDLCFHVDSSNDWAVRLRRGCHPSQVDSATAVATGLPIIASHD